VAASEILVDIVRSGFVEGHHRGSVVALDASGGVDWAIGDPFMHHLPRSCNKPVQAVGLLRNGLDLPLDLLALVSASHSGEDFHIEGVRRILTRYELDESALQTPPDFPLDDTARTAYIRAGHDRAPIAMNCSGKHAGMLATCVVNGWPLADYTAVDHPLQLRLADVFTEKTGEPDMTVAVDGCGAPAFSTSLVGIARAFRSLVVAPADSFERRVVDAFVAHPTMASGTQRDEAALLQAIPGAIGKAGAEACYALALPDGRSIALKIEDGGPRARPLVMAAALRRLGVTEQSGVDGPAVNATGTAILYGGGRPVGELRVSHPALAG
jgi:L-asparaginase II